MDEEAVIQQLSQYGLTNEEAKAYLGLNKLGPSKASTLASLLRFDRVKTYRILDSLRSLGIVESSLSKPMKFTAVPLEKAVDSLVMELKERVRKMESGKDDLLEAWSKLPTLTAPITGPKFKIDQGRMRIYAELVRMIHSAKNEILIQTTRNDLSRMVYAGVYDALLEASRAGKNVRILTQIDQSAIEIVKEYNSIAKLRHLEIPGLASFFTVDDGEILISVTSDDSMKLEEIRDVGLWTDSVEFARVVRTFFQNAWETALDAEAKVQAIVSGVPVEELKVVRNIEEYSELLARMLSSVKTDVTFVVNLPNPKLLPQSFWEVLQGLSVRGVHVRIITSVTANNLEMIKRLKGLTEVRHSQSRLALQMLITDRKEVLLAPSVAEAAGVYMWSNIKAYVYLILQLVDELWNEGLVIELMIQKLEMSIEIKNALAQVRKQLSEAGWELESPAVVKGVSGVAHSFDVIIKNVKQPFQIIAADIRLESEVSEPQLMLSLYARMVDTRPVKTCLLTLSKSGGSIRGEELASTYGIQVIAGKDSSELCAKLLRAVAPIGS